MNAIMNKIIMLLLSVSLFVACNSEEDLDGGNSNDSELLGKILPTTDWGMSVQMVILKQSQKLHQIKGTSNHLRYADKDNNIVLDYKFENGKLIASSLTHANVSNINSIVKSCLPGYTKMSLSESSLVYYSGDKNTLAYGKIKQGSNQKYASVAWTYLASGEDDDTHEGPDFSPSGSENGYDYVDLGLGVCWAVQNVGASSPEKNGGYYMWGETVSRSNSWWWYYSLYTGDKNSYLDDSKFYSPYSDISGTKYDAAKVNMGGDWRMPTRAECVALVNNCKIENGEYNDVKGFVVTGPSGKSIFIPQAGEKKKEDIRGLGVSANIWSSNTDTKPDAYVMNINGRATGSIISERKYYGRSVRGVLNKE